MITTKKFADMCNTTKKTLIHYDRIGLLKPAKREGVFRLYEPRQVLIFQKIVLLKSFGVQLGEIDRYLGRDVKMLALLESQKKDMEVQVGTLQNRIAKASEFMASLKKHGLLINPIIKQVKSYWILALEKEGRYVDISTHQREIFSLYGDTKYRHAGLTIFHDPVFSPEHAHMQTGIYMGEDKPSPVKGQAQNRLQLIHIPAHKTLSYTHVGSYSYMAYIWQLVAKFLDENKLTKHHDIKPSEIYWRGDFVENNEDNLVTELRIPII